MRQCNCRNCHHEHLKIPPNSFHTFQIQYCTTTTQCGSLKGCNWRYQKTLRDVHRSSWYIMVIMIIGDFHQKVWLHSFTNFILSSQVTMLQKNNAQHIHFFSYPLPPPQVIFWLALKISTNKMRSLHLACHTTCFLYMIKKTCFPNKSSTFIAQAKIIKKFNFKNILGEQGYRKTFAKYRRG